MEANFVTRLTADDNGTRRNYAVFDQYVLGRDTLIMYEVDSPESQFYRTLPTGVTLPRTSRTTQPGYLVPRVASRDLRPRLSESIVVYPRECANTDVNHQCGDRWRVSDGVQGASSCPDSPPKSRIALRLPAGHPSTIVEENESGFEPLTPIAGVLQTSWTPRTGQTPPPYSRMDNRRRPTYHAEIDEYKLPVGNYDREGDTSSQDEVPEPLKHIERLRRERGQIKEENVSADQPPVTLEQAPNLTPPPHAFDREDFWDGNDSSENMRISWPEEDDIGTAETEVSYWENGERFLLTPGLERDYQETHPPTLGARARDQQSLPTTVDEQAERDRASHSRSEQRGLLRAERVLHKQRMKSRRPIKKERE